MKTICFIADAASPHTKKWLDGCVELDCKKVIISHRAGEIPGAEVIVHPVSLVGFPRYCWSVRRLIRKLQPEVIHAHQFGAHGLYAWFAGVGKLVITAWGSDVLVKPKKSSLIRWLVGFLARKADLITVDSSDVHDELVKYGAKPDRILFIPFGIKRAVYQMLMQAPKPDDRVILCSPRLHEPIYNIQIILEAFHEVAREFPKVELWVLGDGSLTSELRQYAEKHGMNRVHFWGRVSPEEFSKRIAASHVMISIPSSDATPVSLLEAMAAGSLPILTKLPAYQQWVQDSKNGLLVDLDPHSVATALHRGIVDITLRNQAADINKEVIAENAIWEEKFQPMLKYYKKCGE